MKWQTKSKINHVTTSKMAVTKNSVASLKLEPLKKTPYMSENNDAPFK